VSFRFAGNSIRQHLAEGAKHTLADISNPVDAAFRFGPDVGMTLLYTSQVPLGDPQKGDPPQSLMRAGLGAEDFLNQAVGGLGAGFLANTLLSMTPLRRNPAARQAIAGIADQAGSMIGGYFGPHPLMESVAKKREVQAQMQRDREREAAYQAGLDAGEQYHNLYDPEHQIVNALIPGV
jgi:hypothetical protein